MLDVTPVRAFADNYIWLIHGANGGIVAVDPGDARPVIAVLEAQRTKLAAVLITHHHADHAAGALELKARYSAPVIGPKNETIPGLTRGVEQGESVELGRLKLGFSVLDIPGHTSGHIAFYGHGALFCGDTLFSAGCGRLFEGTAAQMSGSLAKLKSLPATTRVFCGHEYTLNNLLFARVVEPENPATRAYLETARSLRSQDQPTLPSSLELEIAVNPFLRCEEPTVHSAAEKHACRSLETAVDVFAEIRKWKDGFMSKDGL